MGATTIAANSDYPYGDMYTSNSNYHLHGMQGANAMQGGSYMMQAMDMHMDVYDACMEMGYTSNVEAQELADVLRGILDEQEAQLSYTTSSDQYTHSHNSYVDDDAHTQCVSPEEASNYNALPSGLLHILTPFSPLVDLHDSELLCIAKHHLAAPCNAEHLIAPFILDSDPQQMHNVQENPPPCIPSNGADALMPGLSLINHDNHHLDDANRTGMQSINSDNHLDDANHTSMGLINTDNHLDDANHSMEACSKPLVPMHHIDNEQLITLCWLNNAAADANYELSSSKGGLANPAACAHDQGALKIDAEICSDHHPHVVCDDGSYGMRFDHDDGFTKESNMDGDHASKEHMLCTPHPYPMSCDDAFYPRGLSAMQREAVYAAAALQPVDWASVLAVSAGARPKRRNVRISHDPQTVSARRRRERISDRIRVLQRLVPGGTKMDTASMLDEAIHYLKYLKSQVQALEWLERRSSISSSSSSCFYPNLNPRSLSNSRLIK